jgi:hypothetical protein
MMSGSVEPNSATKVLTTNRTAESILRPTSSKRQLTRSDLESTRISRRQEPTVEYRATLAISAKLTSISDLDDPPRGA